MTNTQRKLDQAKYFFKMLDTEEPYFDYILSAFINASRSILWVMGHEYNKSEGWWKWYNDYDVSNNTKQLFKEINDLRVKSMKKSGIKTHFFFLQSDFIVDEKYYEEFDKIKDLEEGEYTLSLESIPNLPNKLDEDIILRFKGKINKLERPYSDVRVNLMTKGKEYLDIMTTVVNSCASKFP